MGRRGAVMAMFVSAASAPAQELATTAPSVTVTGTANRATIAFSSIRGALSYIVMRRIVVIESDGRILPAQPWGAVATVAGSPFVDVVPKPSTSYEYRVDASLRIASSLVSSPIVRYDAPAYTTPTNLAATGSGAQVSLSWTPAVAVVGYVVVRHQLNSDGTETRTQRTPSPITTNSFVDQITTFGVIYNYEVQSVDAIGSIASSGRVKYTAPIVYTPPAVTIVGTGDRATLNWPAVGGAVLYEVARTTLDAAGNPVDKPYPVARNLQAPGFTDVLPGPGVMLRYTVTAMDYGGNPLVSSAGVSFTAAAFTTPVGIVAAGGGGKVSLSWRPAHGVVGYQVVRRTVRPDGAVTDLQVVNKMLNATDFVDTLPTPGLTYEYQVVGIAPDGRLSPSAWLRFVAGTW